MKRVKFTALAEVVKQFGEIATADIPHKELHNRAIAELALLQKLAETNFAACFFDSPNTLSIAAHERFGKNVENWGYLMGDVSEWLRSPLREKCLCDAPSYINGCDNAIAAVQGKVGQDECHCHDGTCPWTKHTGVYQ